MQTIIFIHILMKKITFSTHYRIPSSHLNGIRCVKSKKIHQRQTQSELSKDAFEKDFKTQAPNPL